MPDWLIWAGVIWFIMAFSGRGCVYVGAFRLDGEEDESAGRRKVRRRRDRRLPSPEDVTSPEIRVGHTATARNRLASGGRRRSPGRPRETLETLQRKFVNGTLTIEQYEAELDKLGPRLG